jgi:hypothetical protein
MWPKIAKCYGIGIDARQIYNCICGSNHAITQGWIGTNWRQKKVKKEIKQVHN